MLFLLVAAAIIVPIVLIRKRQQARERKNYERGLKMVPLLIHLPPISEDTDLNGRDVRDLMDENISKAQVVYNIIASTYEKGFWRKVYGQQHFAFEVLSAKGFVYYYATVPVGMVDVVEQAIVSAYPSARLEEAEEHNIFNPLSKISGTAGGELLLKESFAYPIATFQDLKRDAMQALLNSLSTLNKEEGAAIQILMRPADPAWRKTAHGVATGKREGKDGGSGAERVFGVVKEIAVALNKPPEEKDKGRSDRPDLSELDQAVVNAIDDKTRYPGYEVLIRVVVSSNIVQRSQAILNNIVASFSLFDAPGRNGFKYEPAKDMNELLSAYILKLFPQSQSKMILNSVELATIFHFPDQRSIPTSQLERQESKQVDGPRNMPEDGLLLGYNVFRGVKKPVRLAIGDRQRHMYVVGQTGTGKSTFLENLALQDMINGNGFAFVDPHGDTAEKLLSMVPKSRTEDVIYFCPAEMDFPMGLNLFEFYNADQKDLVIQEVLNMLKKLYDPNNQGIMGPRYEDMFRNAALAVMADPAGGTFIEIPQLFRDPQFLKQKLQHVTDQTVRDFWLKQYPASQRSNESGEVTAWFVSKFGAFLSNEMMRNIIGQTKSAFDLRDIMDNKKILLVNLSKGRTGDLNSKLLGMIFVMKFQAAAMSRANIPESQRTDFSLYVDEFQNFSTESFATIMSEARKYRLNLIVANQFTTQLSEEIRDAVFGNMGTIVSFRIGQNDVDSLSRYFQPTFDGDDLLRVPNYNSIVRTLVGGVPTQPFSMSTLPPLGDPNSKLSDALKQLSAAKFGRPKAAVEKDIFDRIATKAPPVAPAGGPLAAGTRPFGPPAGPAPAWGAPAATQSQPNSYAAARPAGSFMDEWLAKRGSAAPAGAVMTPGPIPQGGPSYQAAPALVATPVPTSMTTAPAPIPAASPPPAPQALSIDHSQLAAPAPPVTLSPLTPVPPPAPAPVAPGQDAGSAEQILAEAEQSLADVSPESPDEDVDTTDDSTSTRSEETAGNNENQTGQVSKRRRNRRRKSKTVESPAHEPSHGGTKRIEPLHDVGYQSGLSPALKEAAADFAPAATQPTGLQPQASQSVLPDRTRSTDEDALRQLGMYQKQHAMAGSHMIEKTDAAEAQLADASGAQPAMPEAMPEVRPAEPPSGIPAEPTEGMNETEALDHMIHSGRPSKPTKPLDESDKPAAAPAGDGVPDGLTTPTPRAVDPPPLGAKMDRMPEMPSQPMEHGDTIVIDKEGHLQFFDDSAPKNP